MDKEVVLSSEQMQELRELGIDVSTAWLAFDSTGILTNRAEATRGGESFPTFTLQDILEMLPKYIDPNCSNIKYHKSLFYHEYVNKWICSYVASNGCCIQQFGSSNPLEAAFNMLKWCLENKYI